MAIAGIKKPLSVVGARVAKLGQLHLLLGLENHQENEKQQGHDHKTVCVTRKIKMIYQTAQIHLASQPCDHYPRYPRNIQEFVPFPVCLTAPMPGNP
jgi:hypothetical protein